ncbi:S-phase kinase-associated protein 1 [Aethina tumida]|uniref:S-phase kinase-associated protein 1 n=1 Tax=Aethina tumida TaxID=116153 RepID=UPI002148645C|nr:S-phase kinase-associated protein 1 [Aethina tumida]
MSMEGDIIPIDIEAAKRSPVIEDLVNKKGIDAVIHFPQVSSPKLASIIDYMIHHKNDQPQPPQYNENGRKRSDDISKWDKDFMEMDDSTLFEIILIARELKLEDLVNLACKTIANIMKSLDTEGIRRRFNIEDDLHPH